MTALKKTTFLIVVHSIVLSSAKPSVVPYQKTELSMPPECSNQNYCDHKHSLYPGNTFKNLSNSKILMHLFSSAKPLDQFQNMELTMPAECANQNYCEHKHSLYPADIFRNLTNNKVLQVADDQMTGQRHGEPNEYDEICKKIDEDQVIYEIRDEHNNIRFVAQDINFNKEVRISKCQNPGPISGSVPFIPKKAVDTKEYALHCKEITTQYMFLVLSEDRTSLENVKSKEIPVGCSCRYKSKQQ